MKCAKTWSILTNTKNLYSLNSRKFRNVLSIVENIKSKRKILGWTAIKKTSKSSPKNMIQKLLVWKISTCLPNLTMYIWDSKMQTHQLTKRKCFTKNEENNPNLHGCFQKMDFSKMKNRNQWWKNLIKILKSWTKSLRSKWIPIVDKKLPFNQKI